MIPEGLKQQANRTLQPVRQWYESRDGREQVSLQALAAMLVIAILWFMIWQPLLSGRNEARQQWISAQQTRQWIASNADAVEQARQQGNAPAAGNWIGQLNTGAAAHELTLKGYTPQGDDSVRVLLEDQSLANVLTWLQQLHQDAGVAPSSIEITEGGRDGTVNVRATLERGTG